MASKRAILVRSSDVQEEQPTPFPRISEIRAAVPLPVSDTPGPVSGPGAHGPPDTSANSLVRGNWRPAEIVGFETAVVSFFVHAADLLGVPKSVAAIYGICLASPEPLSFADIDERLEISSGSISQGLRVLREVGALRVIHGARAAVAVSRMRTGEASTRTPNSRACDVQVRNARDYYEPALGLRKVVSHFIEMRLEPQLSAGRTQLAALAKRIPNGNGSAKVLKARMKALQAWHEQARAVLPLVKTLLKLT